MLKWPGGIDLIFICPKQPLIPVKQTLGIGSFISWKTSRRCTAKEVFTTIICTHQQNFRIYLNLFFPTKKQSSAKWLIIITRLTGSRKSRNLEFLTHIVSFIDGNSRVRNKSINECDRIYQPGFIYIAGFSRDGFCIRNILSSPRRRNQSIFVNRCQVALVSLLCENVSSLCWSLWKPNHSDSPTLSHTNTLGPHPGRWTGF